MKETDPALVEYSMKLYEFIGKAPIRVGSRFGFAVNPFFEGNLPCCCLVSGEGAWHRQGDRCHYSKNPRNGHRSFHRS